MGPSPLFPRQSVRPRQAGPAGMLNCSQPSALVLAIPPRPSHPRVSALPSCLASLALPAPPAQLCPFAPRSETRPPVAHGVFQNHPTVDRWCGRWPHFPSNVQDLLSVTAISFPEGCIAGDDKTWWRTACGGFVDKRTKRAKRPQLRSETCSLCNLFISGTLELTATSTAWQ